MEGDQQIDILDSDWNDPSSIASQRQRSSSFSSDSFTSPEPALNESSHPPRSSAPTFLDAYGSGAIDELLDEIGFLDDDDPIIASLGSINTPVVTDSQTPFPPPPHSTTTSATGAAAPDPRELLSSTFSRIASAAPTASTPTSFHSSPSRPRSGPTKNSPHPSEVSTQPATPQCMFDDSNGGSSPTPSPTPHIPIIPIVDGNSARRARFPHSARPSSKDPNRPQQSARGPYARRRRSTVLLSTISQFQQPPTGQFTQRGGGGEVYLGALTEVFAEIMPRAATSELAALPSGEVIMVVGNRVMQLAELHEEKRRQNESESTDTDTGEADIPPARTQTGGLRAVGQNKIERDPQLSPPPIAPTASNLRVPAYLAADPSTIDKRGSNFKRASMILQASDVLQHKDKFSAQSDELPAKSFVGRFIATLPADKDPLTRVSLFSSHTGTMFVGLGGKWLAETHAIVSPSGQFTRFELWDPCEHACIDSCGVIYFDSDGYTVCLKDNSGSKPTAGVRGLTGFRRATLLDPQSTSNNVFLSVCTAPCFASNGIQSSQRVGVLGLDLLKPTVITSSACGDGFLIYDASVGICRLTRRRKDDPTSFQTHALFSDEWLSSHIHLTQRTAIQLSLCEDKSGNVYLAHSAEIGYTAGTARGERMSTGYTFNTPDTYRGHAVGAGRVWSVWRLGQDEGSGGCHELAVLDRGVSEVSLICTSAEVLFVKTVEHHDSYESNSFNSMPSFLMSNTFRGQLQGVGAVGGGDEMSRSRAMTVRVYTLSLPSVVKHSKMVERSFPGHDCVVVSREGKEHQTHSLVLARVEEFAQIIKKPRTQPNLRIDLSNHSDEAINCFIEYLYTGTYPIFKCEDTHKDRQGGTASGGGSVKFALSVLALSVEVKFGELVNHCRKCVLRAVVPCNVLGILRLVIEMGFPDLTRVCAHYFIHNLPSVIDQCSQSLVINYLEDPIFAHNLIEAVVVWYPRISVVLTSLMSWVRCGVTVPHLCNMIQVEESVSDVNGEKIVNRCAQCVRWARSLSDSLVGDVGASPVGDIRDAVDESEQCSVMSLFWVLYKLRMREECDERGGSIISE
eukprot:GHVN01097128.1.p1 GENE.GHVN01097128.1~~GHVN01097128.1.p1  ORF type:complete len:1225 (-),score=260.40 GHVN01097128.1:858-4085(-)